MNLFSRLTANGLRRQETRFNILAHNLSNSQTAGYKKDVPLFQEILSRLESEEPPGDASVAFRQGDLQKTGNELNLAIGGEGFFKVQTPAGLRYTRNGNFSLNRDQVLVQANGFPILGKGGEIVVKGKQVVVQSDGALWVDGKEVGQIALVSFADPGLLRKEGASLFAGAGPLEEQPIRENQIHQGFLEASNVNPLEEMVLLLDTVRSHEALYRAVQAKDEMDGKAVNELARV